MKRIVVLGNSHTMTIQDRLDKTSSQLNSKLSVHYLKLDSSHPNNGNLEVEGALELAKYLTPQDILCICLLGALHNILGLLEGEAPYDFCFEEFPIDPKRLNQKGHLLNKRLLSGNKKK